MQLNSLFLLLLLLFLCSIRSVAPLPFLLRSSPVPAPILPPSEMPTIFIQLYSAIYKALLRYRLLNSSSPPSSDPPSRPANASFSDGGVATKDIRTDQLSSLSLRIFLPDSVLPQHHQTTGLFGFMNNLEPHQDSNPAPEPSSLRRSSYGGESLRSPQNPLPNGRRSSYGGEVFFRGRRTSHRYDILGRSDLQGQQLVIEATAEDDAQEDDLSNGHNDADQLQKGMHKRRIVPSYEGYLPDFSLMNHKKLPIIVQFHGGGFVSGSKDSAANDMFCRRMAKLCDAIVIAVGYRLAPEHKYPAAFDDGFEALSWIAKQANLAECSKSMDSVPLAFSRNGSDVHRVDLHRELVDSFGGSDIVEPWLAAHGDPSRCVLLGIGSGGNIADFVSRQAVQAGQLLEPVKIVAQVLMCPFFLGSIPTRSEIKLANTYFWDKSSSLLAWKLFLPEGEFSLDHLAANPLIGRKDLKLMPPTLTIVAELDWMKDRAIAYSEALRRAKLDAPVLEYKDAVHEFATLEYLVRSKQAEACAEDMVIWIKKYISRKGHEFSY